jgi:hypothetical protein
VTVLAASLIATGLYDVVDEVAAQPVWYGSLMALYTVAAYSEPVQVSLQKPAWAVFFLL